MVSFLVEPPPPTADDKRVHKYPYMTCEVICCENDHVLDALISMREGMMFERIFSLLDTEGELDDRLSGYFEKVVFVLLRRKCLQLMAFLNGGGLPLFRKFVRHLNNYSIMQVVERLFLFQPGWDGQCGGGGGGGQQQVGLDIGEGGGEDASGSGSGMDLDLLRCQWSSMPEVVDILVDQLVEGGETQAKEGGREGGQGKGAAATHTHVASLLLEVIEHASPDSIFIRHLTDKIARLAEVAIPALDLTQPHEVVAAQALAVVKEERSSMLSALTIVEALLSRPQAIKMQWDMGQQQAGMLPPPPLPLPPPPPPAPVKVSMPDSDGEGEGAASPAAASTAADQQEPTSPSSSSFSPPEQPPQEGEAAAAAAAAAENMLLSSSSDDQPPTTPAAEAAAAAEGEDDEGLDGAQAAFPFGNSSGVATLSEEVVEKLIASLPLILIYLQTHEADTRTVPTQIKEPAPKLGLTRLKLVRHVEALVKLCSARVDRPLEDGGVLKVCLDMLFKYEWTSVLHQSITRIVTWIMDAGPSRVGLQTYLVKEGGILERILEANEYNDRMETPDVVVVGEGGKEGGVVARKEDAMEEDKEDEAAAAVVAAAAAHAATAAATTAEAEGEGPIPMKMEEGEEGREEEEGSPTAIHPVLPAQSAATAAVDVTPVTTAFPSLSMARVNSINSISSSSATAAAAAAGNSTSRGPPRCRRGYMGHLFIMSQAIMEAARHQPSLLEEGGEDGVVDVDVDDPIVAGLLLAAAEGRGPPLTLSSDQQQHLGHHHPSLSHAQNNRPSFAQVMETEVDPSLRERWSNFTQGRLAQVTATQGHPLGGYPIPSRADEHKLTTKFDDDNNGGGGEGGGGMEGGPDFDVISDHLAQRLSGVEVGTEGGGEEGGGEQQLQDGGEGARWRRGEVHQMQSEEEDEEEEEERRLEQLQQQQLQQRQVQVGLAFQVGRDPFENDESIFSNEKERFEGNSSSSSSSGSSSGGSSSSSSSGESNGHEGGGGGGGLLHVRQDSIPGLVAGGWAAKAFAEGAPSGGTFGEGWADFSSVSFPTLDTLTMPLGSAGASSNSISSGSGGSPAGSALDDVAGFMAGQTGGGGEVKEGEGGKEEEEEEEDDEEDDFFSSSTTVHLKRGAGAGPGAVAAAAAAAAVVDSNNNNDEKNNKGDGEDEDGGKMNVSFDPMAVATSNSVQGGGGGEAAST